MSEWTEEDLLRAISLVRKGVKHEDIARILGRSKAAVSRRMCRGRRDGIDIACRPPGPPRGSPPTCIQIADEDREQDYSAACAAHLHDLVVAYGIGR